MQRNYKTTGQSKWTKAAYWLVVGSYVTICTLVNSQAFMEFTDGVYFLSLLMAFLISMIEMKLANTIGKAIAHKMRRLATISFTIGIIFVGVLISQQPSLVFGLVILALYSIGILFSYGAELDRLKFRIPKLIAELSKQLADLKAEQLRNDEKLKRAVDALRTKGENTVEKRESSLSETISNNELRINQLSKQKEDELQSIEHLEEELRHIVKRGFGDFGKAAQPSKLQFIKTI